jgi:hypothetical protein
MDTRFAKIVSDLDGRNHILIEGQIVSLQGPADAVNGMVEAIVTGLRNAHKFECIIGEAVLHTASADKYMEGSNSASQPN